MKTITQQLTPGRRPLHQAQDIAADNGINCYSKPCGPGAQWDYITDDRAVFYFSWHGKQIEVVILTGEGIDTPAAPAQEITHSRQDNQNTLF